MNMAKRLGVVGLIVIGAGALIPTAAKFLGAELPDVVRGIIGVVDLAAVPLVVYAAFQAAGNKKQ